jgi:hypothetical protein
MALECLVLVGKERKGCKRGRVKRLPRAAARDRAPKLCVLQELETDSASDCSARVLSHEDIVEA